MKYKTMLLLAMLMPGAANAEATSSDLRAILASALSTYCIPDDISACGDGTLATYDSVGQAGNKCKCDMEQGHYYNKVQRRCSQCAEGYISCSIFASGDDEQDSVVSGGCKKPSCPENMYVESTQFYQDPTFTGCEENTYLSGTMCD
jgi:hypothetical protein